MEKKRNPMKWYTGQFMENRVRIFVKMAGFKSLSNFIEVCVREYLAHHERIHLDAAYVAAHLED